MYMYSYKLVYSNSDKQGHIAECTCKPNPGETPSVAGDRRYTSVTTLVEVADGVFHDHHLADHAHVE